MPINNNNNENNNKNSNKALSKQTNRDNEMPHNVEMKMNIEERTLRSDRWQVTGWWEGQEKWPTENVEREEEKGEEGGGIPLQMCNHLNFIWRKALSKIMRALVTFGKWQRRGWRWQGEGEGNPQATPN